MTCNVSLLRIPRSIELNTRRFREQFNTLNNLALAAALHTVGDIRAGASLQSGDRNGPLHDRVAGLRRMHLLHDAGENILRRPKNWISFKFLSLDVIHAQPEIPENLHFIL